MRGRSRDATGSPLGHRLCPRWVQRCTEFHTLPGARVDEGRPGSVEHGAVQRGIGRKGLAPDRTAPSRETRSRSCTSMVSSSMPSTERGEPARLGNPPQMVAGSHLVVPFHSGLDALIIRSESEHRATARPRSKTAHDEKGAPSCSTWSHAVPFGPSGRVTGHRRRTGLRARRGFVAHCLSA